MALPLLDVPQPDASQQRRAGLYHRPEKDTLELRLFAGGRPPSRLTSLRAQDLGGRIHLQLGWGEDGRLYGIAVLGASNMIPTGVLRGQAGPPPPPGPLAKETDDWFVPLFDGADMVVRERVAVLDGSIRPLVSVMLTASGRIAGFVVVDGPTHLPEAMTSR